MEVDWKCYSQCNNMQRSSKGDKGRNYAINAGTPVNFKMLKELNIILNS